MPATVHNLLIDDDAEERVPLPSALQTEGRRLLCRLLKGT